VYSGLIGLGARPLVLHDHSSAGRVFGLKTGRTAKIAAVFLAGCAGDFCRRIRVSTIIQGLLVKIIWSFRFRT
jgi:hypothetical protein